MKIKHLFTIVACLCVAPVALGDTLTLVNGSSKQGKVVSENSDEVVFRVMDGGMTMNMTVPRGSIAKLERGPIKEAVAATRAAPTSVPATRPGTAPGTAAAGSQPGVPMITHPIGALKSKGFLGEMAAGMVGLGPNSPMRLPSDVRPLWDRAMKADAEGKRAETLELQRVMEAAMRDVPGGINRLENVSRLAREESFGLWMARVHWELILTGYRTGKFDMNDVREVERGPMIGLLKEQTGPSLEPLKSYFPPVNERGIPEAFKPAMLAGITVSNALDVKEQALLASAVLQGQLKLEPKMVASDRLLIANAMTNVQRVLNKCRELEPLARANAAKEKKAAEEKARRDAARPGLAPH